MASPWKREHRQRCELSGFGTLARNSSFIRTTTKAKGGLPVLGTFNHRGTWSGWVSQLEISEPEPISHKGIAHGHGDL